MLVELLVGDTVGYLVGSSRRSRSRNPNPKPKHEKPYKVVPRPGRPMGWGVTMGRYPL